MAAYDEVIYQLGDEDPDTQCCVSGVCDHHAAVGDAFARGVWWERARVTEELALQGEVLPVLLVHGEWGRRVSFFKWGANPHWQRAQVLREAAREVLDDLRESWPDWL
jgi:hypothetical protein